MFKRIVWEEPAFVLKERVEFKSRINKRTILLIACFILPAAVASLFIEAKYLPQGVLALFYVVIGLLGGYRHLQTPCTITISANEIFYRSLRIYRSKIKFIKFKKTDADILYMEVQTSKGMCYFGIPSDDYLPILKSLFTSWGIGIEIDFPTDTVL